MSFQVRDLMSNVLPMKTADDGTCGQQSTTVRCETLPPTCTVCTQVTEPEPPPTAREMLDILRDQMRRLLLPA